MLSKDEGIDTPDISYEQVGHSFDHFKHSLHIYAQNLDS